MTATARRDRRGRRARHVAPVVVALVLGVAAAWRWAPDAVAAHATPADARLVTEDIPRFWAALDAAGTAVDPAVLEREYLAKGTPGLRDFVAARIGDATQLADTVRAHAPYYAALRAPSLRVAEFEVPIRAAFAKLEAAYPAARFPDVWFVVGRLNSGGTTSDRGLLIGVDMYGRGDAPSMATLGDWHRAVLKPVDEIPHIVAHELVHYQQPPSPAQPTLLEACVREGAADFVAERVSGRHINAHVHAYADARAAALWAEFLPRRGGTAFDGWLYGGASADGRPADLGYWIGYQVAKRHHARAADKDAALAEILQSTDAEALLRSSGLLEEFAAGAPR